jgi:hypothetical protein
VQQTQSAAQSSSDAAATEDGANGSAQGSSQPKRDSSFGKAAAMLLLLGIASPFLELAGGFGGVIGLFILFIGLSIAFRLTASKPLDVDGPYSVTG